MLLLLALFRVCPADAAAPRIVQYEFYYNEGWAHEY